MSFTKIQDADLTGVGVIGLPDTPGLSTAAMQSKFEETSRSVIVPKHNALIDELEDTASASSLGATPVTNRVSAPNVQAVMDKLSTDLATVEAGMASAIAHDHTHSNLPLLETYDQTNADITDAVTKKHSHSNKSLLDSYDQTNTDITDAVSKKHDHSNKSLLDSYSQTEANLADAVSKKHDHSNKSLLDSYSQTEANLADAVTKKHTHSNKTVLDKFDESGGQPTYDGNPIGGGGASDTFKNIVSAGTTFTASGDNDTFKINAGSNVTITALSSPDKGIQISATGGGQSTGDMLMSDYDSSGDVKTAGGIDAYVDAQIGALDVSDSAVSGQYVSAVSEADGKISVTRANLPTVPTKVSDLTNDSGYQTASDVSTAISGKEDKTALKDLAYIAKDGVGSTKVLQGDGTWVTPSTGGHTMTPTPSSSVDEDDVDTAIQAALLEGGENDDVVSAFGVGKWSNLDGFKILTTVAQDNDTIGTWEDDATWQTGSRVGWIWHSALYNILSDNDYDIEPIFEFVSGKQTAIACLSYRFDDDVDQTIGGVTVHGGAFAIKLSAPIPAEQNNVKVGLMIKHNRTKTFNGTAISS